jgi:hypothetical protein
MIERLMKDIKTQETPPESREVLLPADVYRALHEYSLESGLEAKVLLSINYCESASIIKLDYVSQEHGCRKGSS